MASWRPITGFQLQASTIRRTANSRRSQDSAGSARPTRRAQPALSKQRLPTIGSARSQPKFSGDAAKLIVLELIGACAMAHSSRGEETPLRPYSVVGDAIPVSLTGSIGDPARGRAIVVSRQSTCLLCHSGPFPEEKFQGNLGPDRLAHDATYSSCYSASTQLPLGTDLLYAGGYQDWGQLDPWLGQYDRLDGVPAARDRQRAKYSSHAAHAVRLRCQRGGNA